MSEKIIYKVKARYRIEAPTGSNYFNDRREDYWEAVDYATNEIEAKTLADEAAREHGKAIVIDMEADE